MLCAMGYLSACRTLGEGTWHRLDGLRARFAERRSRELVVLAAAFSAAVAFLAFITIGTTLGWNDARFMAFMIPGDPETYNTPNLLFAAIVALAIRAALDPDAGGALYRVLGHPFFYPLAALSYTGYLFSRSRPRGRTAPSRASAAATPAARPRTRATGSSTRSTSR